MAENRKAIRLAGHDYTSDGAYFATLCTQDGRCLFGDIVDDVVALNDAGKMIESVLGDLCQRFKKIDIDTHMIMPNHCHAVIISKEIERRGESCIRPELGINPGDHQDRPYDQKPIYNHSVWYWSVFGTMHNKPTGALDRFS